MSAYNNTYGIVVTVVEKVVVGVVDNVVSIGVFVAVDGAVAVCVCESSSGVVDEVVAKKLFVGVSVVVVVSFDIIGSSGIAKIGGVGGASKIVVVSVGGVGDGCVDIDIAACVVVVVVGCVVGVVVVVVVAAAGTNVDAKREGVGGVVYIVGAVFVV